MAKRKKKIPFYGLIQHEMIPTVYVYESKRLSAYRWLEDNVDRLVRDPLDLVLLDDIQSDFCVSGVYFLIKGNEIVYVGQSTQVEIRIDYHTKTRKDFDEVRVLCGIPKMFLTHVEGFYIKRYKPQYNGVYPPVEPLFKPYLDQEAA